jgi:hypothetical protein
MGVDMLRSARALRSLSFEYAAMTQNRLSEWTFDTRRASQSFTIIAERLRSNLHKRQLLFFSVAHGGGDFYSVLAEEERKKCIFSKLRL